MTQLRARDLGAVPGSPGVVPGERGTGARSADDYTVSLADTCRQIGEVQIRIVFVFYLSLFKEDNLYSDFFII